MNFRIRNAVKEFKIIKTIIGLIGENINYITTNYTTFTISTLMLIFGTEAIYFI